MVVPQEANNDFLNLSKIAWFLILEAVPESTIVFKLSSLKFLLLVVFMLVLLFSPGFENILTEARSLRISLRIDMVNYIKKINIKKKRIK
jgi:hypothetical protein